MTFKSSAEIKIWRDFQTHCGDLCYITQVAGQAKNIKMKCSVLGQNNKIYHKYFRSLVQHPFLPTKMGRWINQNQFFCEKITFFSDQVWNMWLGRSFKNRPKINRKRLHIFDLWNIKLFYCEKPKTFLVFFLLRPRTKHSNLMFFVPVMVPLLCSYSHMREFWRYIKM